MTTMADWDLIEPDGETSEEMIEVAEREKLMAEMDRRHSNQMWNLFAGHFGYDGSLVIPIRSSNRRS